MKYNNFGRYIFISLLVIILIIGFVNSYLKKDDELLIESETIEEVDKLDKSDKDKEVVSSEETIIEEKSSIFVHITGAIKKDGMYELESGSRLNDLVEMCGGLKEDADILQVNLSMILEDQMRIHIPKKGEAADNSSAQLTNIGQGAEPSSGKVSINTATLDELMSLPGIGEKRALEIIEFRKSKPFNNFEDLLNISGIGDKTLEKLKDLVKVP